MPSGAGASRRITGAWLGRLAAGHVAAPLSRNRAMSAALKPSPASTSLVSAPGRAGGDGGAQVVRPNRGAGAGWVTPPTSMKVLRAALCG